MMKMLPVATNNVKELSGCWIFRNGEYFLADVLITGHILPVIDKKYENILRTMNIPYRTISRNGVEVCEFWARQYYKEKSYTGKLYICTGGKYRYANLQYTGNIVSIETVKEARKVEKRLKSIKNQFRYCQN